MCRLFEYALVLMCFSFACGHRSETLDGLLALGALLFTAGADFFLVALKEEQWLPGMALFCVAQGLWAVRLWLREEGKRRLVHLFVWAGTCATRLVVAVILARGAEKFGWEKRRKECAEKNLENGRYRYGVGVGLASHTASHYPGGVDLGSAVVRRLMDGKTQEAEDFVASLRSALDEAY